MFGLACQAEASVPAVFPFPEPIPQEIPPRPEILLIWGLQWWTACQESEMWKCPTNQGSSGSSGAFSSAFGGFCFCFWTANMRPRQAPIDSKPCGFVFVGPYLSHSRLPLVLGLKGYSKAQINLWLKLVWFPLVSPETFPVRVENQWIFKHAFPFWIWTAWFSRWRASWVPWVPNPQCTFSAYVTTQLAQQCWQPSLIPWRVWIYSNSWGFTTCKANDRDSEALNQWNLGCRNLVFCQTKPFSTNNVRFSGKKNAHTDCQLWYTFWS